MNVLLKLLEYLRLVACAITGCWIMALVWTIATLFWEQMEKWIAASPVCATISLVGMTIFGSWIGLTNLAGRR